MIDEDDKYVIYDSMFSFMSNSKDKEEQELTLFDIEKNLDNYSTKKTKILANVLIDSICELTAKSNALEQKLENLEHELIDLT